MELRIFQYAVIKQPRYDRDGEQIEAGELVVPITSVLAADEGQAQMLAARAIPEDDLDAIERLVVVISPF